MYDDTPNNEEIDWLEDRLLDIYDYEKLKDCDIDYLHNLEYGVEAGVMIFETSFPADQSVIEGPVRAFIHDDENEEKYSLKQGERMRIELIKREAEREIHRAKGHRIELRRDHRSSILNSISDALSIILRSIPGLG